MPYRPQNHPYHPTPFTPRFNIPETFRECVSYEGQIHYLADLCFDAYEWVEHHKAFYWHYSTQDLSEFIPISSDPDNDGYGYGNIFEIEIDNPLYTWERPGDILGIRIKCEQDNADAVIFAELVPPTDREDYSEDETGYSFDNACFPPRTVSYPYKIRCRWLYFVRDFSEEIEMYGDAITLLETKVTNLENRMTSVENRMTSVENRVSTLETNVSNLQTQVENLQKTVENLTTSTNANSTTLQAIINKLGGGTINSDGSVSFTLSGIAAIGNINVYSQTSDPASSETGYLKTHSSLTSNDIWFNNEEG